MWIYFVEQVWLDAHGPDQYVSWCRGVGWQTTESANRFWDRWHDRGYKHTRVYEQCQYLEMGNDYTEF